MLEDPACDLCGGVDVAVLHAATGAPQPPARVFSASSTAPLTERLVRCRACGLVFVSPRPPAGDILDAYAQGEDAVYASQAGARERTFEGLLDRIEELHGNRGRLFDVGAATGTFLAAARRRGWAVDGCEPNAWLVSRAAQEHGLALRAGSLETIDLAPRSCDAVTLWDVVEHLPSPSAAVTRAAALLKPGGHLFLTFPDIGSVWSRALGRRWPLLRAMHLYYFSKATMGRMLREAGFEVVWMEPHAPLLEAAFLIERAADALHLPGKALASAASRTGAGRRYVRVRMGQTFAAARRVRA